MRTSDEKNLEKLYESELDRYYQEDEDLAHKQWEAYKEASLEFEDELAELDFDSDPEGVVAFLKELTAMVVKHNASKKEVRKPTPTPEYIKSLQQADIQKKIDRMG